MYEEDNQGASAVGLPDCRVYVFTFYITALNTPKLRTVTDARLARH